MPNTQPHTQLGFNRTSSTLSSPQARTKTPPSRWIQMGFVKLELPCPKTSAVVASADPDPRWNWDDLFTELHSLEERIGAPSGSNPLPLKDSDHQDGKEADENASKPFIMSISDDDTEESGSEDEAGGTRFSGKDIDFSDSEDSGDESRRTPTRSGLMERKSLEEGMLFELESEHRLKMKEQLRNKFSALESYQQNGNGSAMFQLERFTQSRREMDRRLDNQYQRKVSEVLDKHLSVIQRDHQQRSQIEERRIRDDAAAEEARREEKRLQEEKIRQEKAKAEEEARLRAITLAEEKRKVALEAEKMASKEAAEKEAARIREAANAAAEVAFKEAQQKKTAGREMLSQKMGTSSAKDGQLQGIHVMATDAALKAETSRLKTYDEVATMYHSVAQDLSRHARKIQMLVAQISGNLENVRAKATALMNIFKNPECPQPISILIFAKKVVCLCDNQTGNIDTIAFACGHVILLLTSQVPTVMEFVLAEFHKACIYTVPKYLRPSHPTSNTKDFFKIVGYREEDGKLESSDSYLNRVSSYIKLYAAMVQTEIEGIRNPHGLKEGWAWLAWFLNALPANRSTAVALESFLMVASFGLHRRYGRQFRKILNVIEQKFLPSLKERDPGAGEIITRFENFFQFKVYGKEPEGRQLRKSLLSNEFEP